MRPIIFRKFFCRIEHPQANALLEKLEEAILKIEERLAASPSKIAPVPFEPYFLYS